MRGKKLHHCLFAGVITDATGQKFMKRDIGTLTDKEFDLIVVGGGIFGACAAWDAAQRGLSVALVERGDFACATSAHSFKR